MSGNFLHHLDSGLLAYVVEPAARSLALAFIAGIALKLFRVQSVTVRFTVWRGVLCAALAMPILVSLLPSLPFPVPASRELQAIAGRLAPGQAGAQHAAPLHASIQRIAVDANGRPMSLVPKPLAGSVAEELVPAASRSVTSETGISGRWAFESWRAIGAVGYFAVVLFVLIRFFAGLWRCRNLTRTSATLFDPRLRAEIQTLARNLGLASIPEVRESRRLSVPLTLGVTRPAILLPADWRAWDDGKLYAVLAHELSHVARRDALTQRLALLHSALFCFSPLSWWLERRLAELAEEASDEAALASGVDRVNYAETLLSFFTALHAAPPRVRWQGLSMATFSRAERRVDRILAWKGNITMNFKKSLLFGGVLLAAPCVVWIAAARPAHSMSTPAAQSASVSPEASPSTAQEPIITVRPESQKQEAPEAPQPASESEPSPAASAPTAATPTGPALPGVAAPPLPAAPREAGPQGGVPSVTLDKPTIYVRSGGSNSEHAYRLRGAGGCNYNGWSNNAVVVSIGDECTSSNSAARNLPSVNAEIAADSITFEHDGKAYVIEDAATVERARRLFEPVIALGQQQSELGRQQSALGEKQSAIGDQMKEVRVKLPDLTAQLKEIETKMAQLSADGGTVSQLGELQSRLGEVQSRIGEIESHAGQEQGKIGQQQGELGRQQGDLGRKQGELGKKQGELSEAGARELSKILDDAMSRNLAKQQAL